MRPIDADALINEIKKDAKKAIEQDDIVGSFWLGYIAGLVIKQPTIQPEERSEKRMESHACDCISRQAAIDAAKHAWAKGLEPSQYIEIIPPAQPEPHWIPCTERMPHNTGDFYLCTAKLSVDDEYEVELLMLDTANDFNKSYFSKCIHNGLVFRESWSGGNEALDVIAWMPLPEPYKPEERKDGEANAEYRD